MMYSNALKINYALSLINGATQLDLGSWYWTSTEGSSQNAWRLNFSDGNLNNWNDKVQNKGHVRPVSALNKEDK